METPRAWDNAYVGRKDFTKVDLDEVLEKFKQGVCEQVADDDLQTHLDLGIAYAEMGLLDDAEAEFAHVLKFEPANAKALAEMAMVHRRRNVTAPEDDLD